MREGDNARRGRGCVWRDETWCIAHLASLVGRALSLSKGTRFFLLNSVFIHGGAEDAGVASELNVKLFREKDAFSMVRAKN